MSNSISSQTRTLRWLWCGLVATFVVQFEVAGQFYSPRTEEHDPAQRFFVTEVCRLLAWKEQGVETKLATVTNSVYPQLTGDIDWHIRFLSTSGSLSKTGLVSYPTNLLDKGEVYYRDVFRKVQALGWAPIPKALAVDLRNAFWQGALRAKPSREASLIEAFDMVSKAGGNWGAVQAAELSGLLTHAVLPGVVGRCSIDSVLLARAIGWLTFAEAASSEPLPDLYIPGLF